MAEEVKLAFIGCGGITRSHLEQGLKNFEDVQFVGWCDVDEKAAAARREQDRAFIDSVKAGEDRGILATYEDGLKAVAIACAADESMRTGKVVEVKV